MGISTEEVKSQLILAFAGELLYHQEQRRLEFYQSIERFYRTGFQDFWAIDRVDDYMTPDQALTIDIRLVVSAAARFIAWLEFELCKESPVGYVEDRSLAEDYVSKRVGSLSSSLVSCWSDEGTLLSKYHPQASVYNDNKLVSAGGQKFFKENIWLGVFYMFLVLGCGTELKAQIENLQNA